MTIVWLHSTDGRRLWRVLVSTPMPPAVTYAGAVFVWQGEFQQYRQTPVPLVYEAPPSAEGEEETAPGVPHPEHEGDPK